MSDKLRIAELFISFAISIYYFDILIRGSAELLGNNMNSHILLVDFLFYIAFTLVYVPISKKYIGLYKTVVLIVFPTFLSLTLLYWDFNYEQNKLIVLILLIFLLIGIATLLYTVIKIPVWVIRHIKS